MKKFLPAVLPILALWLPACSGPPTPLGFEQQNKPLVLRCTLRPNGPTLYASNYLGIPATVRAGSPAEVTMFSTARVDMTLNKIAYQMFPVSQPFTPNPEEFVKKYFVKSEAELGLGKLEEAKRRNIQNGLWEVGMTQDQVYTALGPPNWVNFNQDATNLTHEQIMNCNRWEYRESDIMASWWPVKRSFTFQDGKLIATVP